MKQRLFFHVCKKSESTTRRFPVLCKAYKTARVHSRDSNCTANIHEITRTLLCTDGWAEDRQHGFRWTKHGESAEQKRPIWNAEGYNGRSKTRLHCIDDKGLLGKLGTSCNCSLLGESSHQTLTAVYAPCRVNDHIIFVKNHAFSFLLLRLQIRFINSILNISSPRSFPSSRARLTGNHPEHLGRGSSRCTLQPLGGRCEHGSPLCCEDFSTHQALQGLICGWGWGVQERGSR